ncbi:tyrosine-type recombinase/integrase [Dickeya dianthicola]|uniref:tyrosine-type recombinase/integrase n=1 Tax=Dickeya dianthicola TaxID=204039 RepID=UPI003016BFA0
MTEIGYESLLDDYFFSKSLRPATEWSYRKVTNSFIRFASDIPPCRVDRTAVLHWRRHLLTEKKVSAITWNNKVAHMRAIFNHGIKHRLLPHTENPFNNVITRPDMKRKKTLAAGQLDAIDRLMEQHLEQERQGRGAHFNECALYPAWFWKTVLDTLRYTGMRQNQLLHIRLSDVNLDTGIINLRPEGSKNHREHRVPIISALHQGLSRLIEESIAREAQPDEQLFNVHRFIGRASNDMVPMSETPLRSFFRRLSNECRFTVSPHRFRHTLATEMMKSPDRNLQIVKNLLGHSSLNTTLEYVESNIDSIRAALEGELRC